MANQAYNGQPVNISFDYEGEGTLDSKLVQLSESAAKDPTTWLKNGIYRIGNGQPVFTQDGKILLYLGRNGNATDIADDTKWVKFATEADFEEFLSHADLGNVVRAANMAQKTNYIPKFTSADGREVGASGITENDLNDVLKEMRGTEKAETPSNPIVGTHGYMIKLFRERGNTFGSDYVLQSATDNALGGIMTGFTAEAGVKQYPVLLDANGKAYVAVPWTDTQAGNATESEAGLITAAEKKYLNVVTAEIATAAENTFIADIVALIPKVGSRAFVVSLNIVSGANNNFFGFVSSIPHVLALVNVVSASVFTVHFVNYQLDGTTANVVYCYDSATKILSNPITAISNVIVAPNKSLADMLDAASGIPIMDSNEKVRSKNLPLENSLSNNTNKIPTSKAVKDAIDSIKLSLDFTYYGTVRYINPDAQTVHSVKLVNTGAVKLWENGVEVLAIPSQEATDSGMMYTYTLPTPHTIAAGTKVWWTIERDADNATERILSIY